MVGMYRPCITNSHLFELHVLELLAVYGKRILRNISNEEFSVRLDLQSRIDLAVVSPLLFGH